MTKNTDLSPLITARQAVGLGTPVSRVRPDEVDGFNSEGFALVKANLLHQSRDSHNESRESHAHIARQLPELQQENMQLKTLLAKRNHAIQREGVTMLQIATSLRAIQAALNLSNPALAIPAVKAEVEKLLEGFSDGV